MALEHAKAAEKEDAEAHNHMTQPSFQISICYNFANVYPDRFSRLLNPKKGASR